jgi:hypothetical protein
VVPIIERIDLGCASNPMRVLIRLTALLEVLYPLFITHGMPHYIRSDNGPEFTADVFQKWLTKVGIKPIRIYPGSPWENGYNERYDYNTLNKWMISLIRT